MIGALPLDALLPSSARHIGKQRYAGRDPQRDRARNSGDQADHAAPTQCLNQRLLLDA
jgi:hypothetical protein